MKYLLANWKMYLNLKESLELTLNYKNLNLEDVKMVIFPSALSFSKVKEELEGSQIETGPQNIYWVDKGGYTGEVSAQMYKDEGAGFALVGHSERRHQFKETNEDVKNKMKAILESGLVPVLCVGETKAERDAGQTELVVKEQLITALEGLSLLDELIIAYEPVWAIGTGDNCSVVSAEHMIEKIKAWVKEIGFSDKVIVLYGGSVRPENVVEYLSQPAISGVLVGGASTKFEEWSQIVKNAQSL